MPEQRKSKRFELKLPIELIRNGSQPINKSGETKNLSSAGVLFTSETPIEVGSSIEYLITLPNFAGSKQEVRLRCMGKVIRLDKKAGDQPEPLLAATLERYEFVRTNE